jgi:hypothetical protein
MKDHRGLGIAFKNLMVAAALLASIPATSRGDFAQDAQE